MSARARLAYVQSRLQARHGRRLSESDWRLLEATDDLGGYVQAARGSFFDVWIYHLAAGADVHQIERSLRQDWRAYCEETAAWLPQAWQPSTRWLATLVDLPAIAHLARGEAVWRWMPDDPGVAPLALHDRDARRQALSASRYAKLADAVAGGMDPLAVWLRCWLELAPAGESRDVGVMREIARVAGSHLIADADRTGTSPARLRSTLYARLTRVFRRWSGGMGAVFAHLALVALDAERLRAGLVLRALVPRSDDRPLWA